MAFDHLVPVRLICARAAGTGAKNEEALHPVYGYDDHSIWIVSSSMGMPTPQAHN
jgi:hypothetical protein